MSVSVPNSPGLTPETDQSPLTSCAWNETVGAGDVLMNTVFNAGYARRLYFNTGGTVYVKKQNDATALPYVVAAGAILDGVIVLVGGTTNFPSATAGVVYNAEF